MISWHKNKDAKTVASGWWGLAYEQANLLERLICTNVWSPIRWRDGQRREGNFLGALVCALDFDSAATTIAWASEAFAEYDVTIGTTKSHARYKNGVACDRFRVLLWFTEPIMSLELYKHNMALLIDKYKADKACKDGARFFFPCKEIVDSHGGKTVDVIPLPVVVKKKFTHYGLSKPIQTSNKIPNKGNRNNYCYWYACRLFEQRVDHAKIPSILQAHSGGLGEREINAIVLSAKKETGN